ncbi:hypothetical protein [Demetria terragena]|uniref:hypothetical protein n=1 Tax=Demetria terragena TaxID=63959 RepID=UPI000382633A|nr:hypothetical protein [Demetria terragena]
MSSTSVSSAKDLLNYDSFDRAGDRPAAKTSSLGKDLGPGISEAIDASTLSELKKRFSETGRGSLPQGTKALRYMDSGEIYAVDATGKKIARFAGMTASVEDGSSLTAARGVIHPEVKRIIGACIGIGVTGGISAETIVQMFNTPAKAAKFVVRRLGVFGAVSCAGGIIWEYI